MAKKKKDTDFMRRVKNAVRFYRNHPDERTVVIARKYGIHADTLRKYANPRRFEKVTTTVEQSNKSATTKEDRNRKWIFAKVGTEWVRPEHVPAHITPSEFRVMEFSI